MMPITPQQRGRKKEGKKEICEGIGRGKVPPVVGKRKKPRK